MPCTNYSGQPVPFPTLRDSPPSPLPLLSSLLLSSLLSLPVGILCATEADNAIKSAKTNLHQGGYGNFESNPPLISQLSEQRTNSSLPDYNGVTLCRRPPASECAAPRFQPRGGAAHRGRRGRLLPPHGSPAATARPGSSRNGSPQSWHTSQPV